MSEIKKQFETWAKGYSGIDGGQLKEKGHWFCGIEYGGQYGNLMEETKKKVDEIPSVDKNLIYKELLRNPFDQKVAKIYTVSMGVDINKWRSHCESINFCTSSSNTFKLNIYPIACKNASEDLWTIEHFRATGFPTKSLYKAWCQQHRFPMFKNLREKYNPEIIICVGASYCREFLLAFGGEDYVFSEPVASKKIQISNSTHYVHEFKIAQTKLFVLPFVGRPLNSNKDLITTGEFIRESLSQNNRLSKAA